MKSKIIVLVAYMLTCTQSMMSQDQDQQLAYKKLGWMGAMHYGYGAYIKTKMDHYSLKAKGFYRAYCPTIIQNNPVMSLSLVTAFIVAGGAFGLNWYFKYLKNKKSEDTNKKQEKQIENKLKESSANIDLQLIDEMRGLKRAPNDYPCAKSFTNELFLNTVIKGTTVLAKRLEKANWFGGKEGYGYFVRKLVVPTDADICMRGDLHGDVHSLIRWLDVLRAEGWFEKDNPFKLTKESLEKHRYLAFLGDYVDKGHYGAEVTYIIMRLVIENQDNILLVRGNHEESDSIQSYGHTTELEQKFSLDKKDLEDIIDKITDMYAYLPVAIFLGYKNSDEGVNYLLCCHGGVSPSHDTSELLETKESDVYQRLHFYRKNDAWEDAQKRFKNIATRCNIHINQIEKKDSDNIQKVYEDFYYHNEYQWSDLDLLSKEPSKWVSWQDKDRFLCIHQKGAECFLKTATKKDSKNKVYAILRAHQHNKETVPIIVKDGNGLFKSWSKKVSEQQFEEDLSQQWSGKDGVSISIEEGSAITLNVAPCTGCYEKYYENFTYDTVINLHIGKKQIFPRKIPVNNEG